MRNAQSNPPDPFFVRLTVSYLSFPPLGTSLLSSHNPRCNAQDGSRCLPRFYGRYVNSGHS